MSDLDLDICVVDHMLILSEDITNSPRAHPNGITVEPAHGVIGYNGGAPTPDKADNRKLTHYRNPGSVRNRRRLVILLRNSAWDSCNAHRDRIRHPRQPNCVCGGAGGFAADLSRL